MVSIKIKLSRPDLSPPIFLAGSFTEWQPSLEMDVEEVADDSGHRSIFYKIVDLDPGIHGYKFRLGHGDWWIADECAERGRSAPPWLCKY